MLAAAAAGCARPGRRSADPRDHDDGDRLADPAGPAHRPRAHRPEARRSDQVGLSHLRRHAARGAAPDRRQVSCANCHLNAGQRERALPLVGITGMFPEYNNRAARLISLQDRVVDCFLRSENGTGRGTDELPSTGVEGSAGRHRLSHVARPRPRRRREPGVAQQECDRRRQADPGRQARRAQRRASSTPSGARPATEPTVRASRSATRKPVRCGATDRGTTAPARRASTRWPASSATRCRT